MLALRLFLPESWSSDRARLKRGVPADAGARLGIDHCSGVLIAVTWC